MADQFAKTTYNSEELAEFDAVLVQKLTATTDEINFIKKILSRSDDNGTDSTASGVRTLEDGADMRQKEQLSQSAARLQKFASQLEAARIRIKNGTYGVCKDTGELIPKERLMAVPHTQQTVEAKLKQN
ncbi:MAG: TraR/DksA C4-type zinc finger protein [Spirosomaceae bacterium]|nr:TraR/DksA C4-type zinc finger protein [Spirosomataceae bacterium]MDP5139887.1 TraR/DksA C4-type zinc finger protein [Spirosomataceae bacterium]